MGTLVNASLPADQFALATSFEQVPTLQVEATRLVSQGDEDRLPLIRGTNSDPAGVLSALEEDPTTTEVDPLARRDGEVLARVDWCPEVHTVVRRLVCENGVLVSASAESRQWSFELLFPERDGVGRTYEQCLEDGVDLGIERICSLAEVPPLRGLQLTDEQFRSVKVAFEEGYYEVPRNMTLQQLANELDVSHQALSERLRRGHRRLIEDMLGPRPTVEASD